MRTLAIDHGSFRSGFSVFEDGKYCDSGFYTFPDRDTVLMSFSQFCSVLISVWKPDLVILERQIYAQNVISAAMLFKLNGITELLCLENQIPYIEYVNTEWKKNLGFGTDKVQIGRKLAEELYLDINQICVPVYYTRDTKKAKKGAVREYLCDESDAIGMNLSYWRTANVVNERSGKNGAGNNKD